MADIVLTSTSTVTLAGLPYNESLSVFGHVGPNGAWTLPTDQTPGTALPQEGVLTVRGSATAGTATMDNAAPGIAAASLVDVYWTDVLGYARVLYGCTVGTVTAATSTTPCTIAFSGGTNSGAGTDLPPLGTAVILAPSTAFQYLLNGETLLFMAATCPVNALINFYGGGYGSSFGTGPQQSDFAVFLPYPGMLYRWIYGTTNPLLGYDITQVYVSQCSLAALAAGTPQTANMVSLGTLVGA